MSTLTRALEDALPLKSLKVSISNRMYFKPDEELWEYVKTHTTYSIMTPGAKFPKVFQNCGKVGKGIYWMPITRMDLLENKGFKPQVIDRRACPSAKIPKPSFNLRPDQKEIYDDIVKDGVENCIINGKPGFGKTILALALAHALQVKTLVICTNTSIRTMWVKEVERHFGFTPGIIGSGKMNIDSPIVISNIQTLNKHSQKLGKEFGLVIVDEMHHCVATTFTNFLTFSSAKYKIGLSGTLKRKDGLNVMFKDFFGTKVYSPSINNTVPPTIHTYKIPVELSGNMAVPWATRANDVYMHPVYKSVIQDLCRIYADLGHKVLFVSDRTAILEELSEFLNSIDIPAEVIIGTTGETERLDIQGRVARGETKVLCASQSIFSEGISLNELSCLILGSLVNNESLLEQLAGRIQRITEDKLDPVFVDIRLTGGVAWNQAASRRAVYLNNGWKVLDITQEMVVAMAYAAKAECIEDLKNAVALG